MGNSLRDELLKVGLVSDERLKKARRRKPGKAGPGNKRKQSPTRPPGEQTDFLQFSAIAAAAWAPPGGFEPPTPGSGSLSFRGFGDERSVREVNGLVQAS